MGIEVNQLPAVISATDDDILHLQTSGSFVDKHIKKSDLLKDIQAEVDNNTSLTPYIVTNTTSIDNDTKVIEYIGGGTLVAKRINELRDGGTYILPLAGSVSGGDIIVIDLPDTFSAFTPLVERGGSDNIRDVNGVDVDILFNAGGIRITMFSNGINEWRL